MSQPATRTRVRIPTHLSEWQSALSFYGGRRKGSSIASACPLCGGTDRFHVRQVSGKVIGGCRHCINGQADGARRWLEVCRRLFGEDEQAIEYRQTRRKPEPPPEPEPTGPDPAVVAKQAQDMLLRAKQDVHPYLEAKGFPELKMMVLDGDLLVPLHPIEGYGQVTNLQRIKADGSKKFLYGGRAGKSVFRIGKRGPVWWCEGFATALSIRAALDSIHRQGRIIACYSATTLGQTARGGYVIADHDWWQCRNKHRWDDPGTCPVCGLPGTKPAGQKAAETTGRPWWQPAKPGMDANDLHLEQGLDVLANELLQLIRRTRA